MAYDRAAAVAYARKWALDTNPDYPRFDNDCTNFISQVMLAGGWTMVDRGDFLDRKSDTVWWYGGSWWTRASYTWGGAHNFSKFIKVSGRGSEVTDPLKLDRGDVVQIKKDTGHVFHSMAVTENTGSDLLLCYHTSDHYDKKLSAVQASYSPTAFIYWKVSDTVL